MKLFLQTYNLINSQSLTPDQQFAADVTEDGTVSGSDAQAILRYSAFFPDNIASTGQWRFDPVDTTLLLSANAVVDFRAFLLGDVTGNWGILEKDSELTSPASWTMTLDKAAETDKNLLILSIALEKITVPVQTLLMSLSYNEKSLKYQSTRLTELTEKFMMEANGTETGKVHIAMAGVEGVKQEGKILRIAFEIINPAIKDFSAELEITRLIMNDYREIYYNSGELASDRVQVALIPDHFDLSQNYPNPFNPQTYIRYQIPVECQVILQVFNLRGERVRTLVNGFQTAQFYEILWDGKNELGQPVAAGIYICQLQAGEYQKSIRLVLVR